MYSTFQLAKKYCLYFLDASNGKGHGVHSPFVFRFIIDVLNDKTKYDRYKPIEALRVRLLNNKNEITIRDLGAGSRVNTSFKRKISHIAASSLKSGKFAQLLFRMARYYKPENILEMGTSLGITTAYLASANNNTPVITMEGASSVAALARENFKTLKLNNISVFEGNFDETLESALQTLLPDAGLVFIDGNHRREPTIHYFNKILTKTSPESILIFDDIHWSREMEESWKLIQQHETVTLTIDLFFIGLVFFRKEIKEKQHFTIRF